MITGSHNALPVRLTAASSHKACWRHVRRISVGLTLCGTLWFAVSACAAAEPKKDDGLRILPATKSHAGRVAGMYANAAPRRAGKPDSAVPPLPAEPDGRREAHQMRIIPSRDYATAPDFQHFEQIYRSIPYSRLSYQANPRYREELALALLFKQFPPSSSTVMPSDSGMDQGGPMWNYGGGAPYGYPTNPGPPAAGPLNWMLTVPPQWLY
jgi:hypothetical protein